MAEQKVKLTHLPEATDTVDTAVLLVNQNETDQRLPITHFLRSKNNLSELENTAQARANLGVPSVEDVNDKVEYLIDGKSTFLNGATLESERDFIWDDNSKNWYYWTGAFSKEVPAASNPDSTGGIGAGAWLSVGDATVRNWVKSNIGLSDTMDELISNLNTVGAAIIHGTHEVPVGGLGLPVASTLTAVGQRVVQFSGDLSTVASRGYFTKSNNTSVTITNPNTSSDNETLDTIAYVNTETLGKIGDNEIWGSGVVIRDSAFRGTAPNMNDAGIFVLNGGYHIFENVQVVNTKFGFKFGDVYLTNLIRCHTSGAIQQMGGTSTHYDNVWARGHLDVVGAFHFEGLNYSVLDSICSDRPRRGFLYLKNCVGLTFNSAATEGPGYFGNLTEEQGGAAIIDSGNHVTFNNLQISPISSYTGPLISIGNDNNVIIDRLFTNNGVAYTSADLYVHGDGSFVEIKSARVRVGRNMPLIHIKPRSTSKVVVWLNGGNRAILTAGETKETPFIEYEYKREVFNPILLIGESSTGITYLGRSGSWSKAGNMVTVNFTISLSSKGNLSGNLSIGNLPFNVPANTGGILLNYANMANGPFSLGSVTGGPNISIRRSLATATIIATNSEINNDSVISGSITYQIASSLFNSMPS